MNDKVVTLPVAKRLKEAGWVKETEWVWYYSSLFKEYLCGFNNAPNIKRLRKKYFAPDLLDLTREIIKMMSRDFDYSRYEFKEILFQKNEVDYAAEIWIEMKQEGL